jgi:hypothetical protein
MRRPLSPTPASALRPRDHQPGWVQRIRRQIEYQQVIAATGHRSVLGSGEAMEHILERGVEQGVMFDRWMSPR